MPTVLPHMPATHPPAHQHKPHPHHHQQPAGSSRCGVVQGYIVVQVNSVTAHINKLAVAPEARRSGLATRLLQVRGQ